MFKYLILLILISCVPEGGNVSLGPGSQGALGPGGPGGPGPDIFTIAVVDHQLIINGKNFLGITHVTLKDPATGAAKPFAVKFAGLTKLISDSIDTLSVPLNKGLDLILSNAYGQTTYPVTFTLQDDAVAEGHIQNGAVTRLKLNKEPGDTPGDGDVLVWNGVDGQFDFAPYSAGGGGGGVVSITRGVGIANTGTTISVSGQISVDVGVTGAPAPPPGSPTLSKIPFFNNNNKIELDSSTSAAGQITGLIFKDGAQTFDIYNDTGFLDIVNDSGTRLFSLDYSGDLKLKGSSVCTQATGCSGVGPGAGVHTVTAVPPLVSSGTATDVIINAGAVNTANNLVQLDATGGLPAIVFGPGKAQRHQTYLDNLGTLNPNPNYMIIGNGSSWAVQGGDTLLTSIGAQKADSDLSSLSGLSPALGNIIVGASATWTTSTIPNCGASGNVTLSNGTSFSCSGNLSPISAGTLTTFGQGVQIKASPSPGELHFFGINNSNYVGLKAADATTADTIWTLPPTDGVAGSALITDGAGILSWVNVGGGNDLQILGPSTDKAIVRFKGTSTKEVQNSGILISDLNDISGVASFTSTGTFSNTGNLFNSGNLSVDGSTLSVDSITHRVGVGTSGANITNLLTLPFGSDGQGLEFNETTGANDYFIGRAATHGSSGLVIGKSSAKTVAGDYSFMAANDGSTYINAASGKTIHFKNNNGLDRFSIDSTGAFVPSNTGLRFSDGTAQTITLMNPPAIASGGYVLRLPATLPGSTQALVSDNLGNLSWGTTGGDVTGPAGPVGGDNVVIFNGASGKIIQDSGIPSANLLTNSSPFTEANRVVLATGIGREVTQSSYTFPLTSCPSGQILKSNASGDFVCALDLDTGNVVGAASPTAGNLPEFADGTGKILADSGIPSADVPTMATGAGMLYKPILSSDSAKGLVAAPYTFPNIKCPTGFILKSDLSGNFDCAGDDNTGNVRLPGSSTDKAIVRFLGNNTKDIQNSGIIISDANDISGVAQFTSTGDMSVGGNSLVVNTVSDQVGIGTATPTTSAILDLNSSNKGFLPPRMDTNARNGIVSPANGLLIYNSETNTFNARINGTWETLTGDVYGPASSIDGNVTVFSGSTGNVIRDSLIKSADLVTMTATATLGNILTSAGGKVAGDSSVKISDVPTMSAAAASSNTVVLSEGADKKLKTTPYTIPPAACAPGEILKADGAGNFICGADSNTAPPVTSVFSRTGDVVAMPGDYFSDQISSTPTVNISANNVKGALDEIYAEKLSLTGGNMSGIIYTNSPIVSTAQDAFELGPFGAGAGNTGEIRFRELTGSDYVGFKAPDGIPSNTIWTLPAADGVSGTILTTDGNKFLSWNSPNSLGIGDVMGPPTSTTNSVPKFSDASGKKLSSSGILISPTNDLSGVAGFTSSGNMMVGTNALYFDSASKKLGIGNAAPNYNLDVTGTAAISSDTYIGGTLRITGATTINVGPTPSTFPIDQGTDGQFLRTNGSGILSWKDAGDVVGPGSSASGTLASFNGNTGKLIQDSGIVAANVPTMAVAATGTYRPIVSGGSDKTLMSLGYSIPLVPCANGQILKSDALGNFSCADDVSGVTSFNTRTGAVVSMAGDYFSDQISSTPTVNISANTVKGALDEIYAEKLSLTGGTMTGTIFTNSPIVSTAQDAFELGPFGASAGNTGEIRFMELTGSEYVGFKAPDAIASNTIWTLPATKGLDGDILTTDGNKNLNWNSPASLGIGDVVGPATATDGNLASFDGSGKLIQDSNIASVNVVTMNLPAGGANRILTSAAANKVAIDTGVLIDGSNNVTGTNAFTSSGNMTVGGIDFFVNTTTHQVGMGTATPNASAILDLTSTTKALLLPRMTTAQRDAIGGGSPTDGLLIYNTTSKTFNGRIAGNWEAVTGDVYGPDLSTPGNVTMFGSADGKIIADSGIPSVNLVTMTASATDGNILTAVGGKGAVDSFVNILDVPTMSAPAPSSNTVVLSEGADKKLKTTPYTIPTTACASGELLIADASGNFRCGKDTGGVASFNGRTGDVVSISGDYFSDQISSTPTSDISANNVKGALDEIYAEKLSLTGGNMTGTIFTNSPIVSTAQDAFELGPFGASGGNTGEIRFMELVGSNFVGFKAPDAIASTTIWTLPATQGGDGDILTTDGNKNLNWNSPASLGIGDVVGPATATDGNLASFDGSGKLIQDSNIASANVVTMNLPAQAANRILTSAAANKVAIDTGVLIDGSNNVTGTNAFTSSGNMTVGGTDFFVNTTSHQVGMGTATPNASAILDLTSTTKALLLPRMSTAQRDAIGGGSPTDGLLIYNTTSKTFNGRIAGNWEAVTGDVYGPDNSTAGNVTMFGSADGKIIADSGIPSVNLVTMTASATDGNILTAVGGKGAVDSFVNILDVPTMAAAAVSSNTLVLSEGADKKLKTTPYTFPSTLCSPDKILKTDGLGNFQCVDDVSGVTSFNTRKGDVVPMAGDYFSDQISSTPTSDISANTVKGALDEIYAEKLSLTGGTMTGTIFTNSPIVSTAQDAFELGPFGASGGNTGEIRFKDLAGGNWVGFKAPDNITSSLIWTLPAAAGTTGTILTTNGNKELSWNSPSSLGIGDVVGPSSSTQFAIAKYSDTTGKKLSDSKILISPTNDLSGVVDFTSTGDMIVGSNALFVDSSGTKVGIGKAAPVQTLDVNGTAAISSSTYIGGTLRIDGLTTFNAGGAFSTFPIGRGASGQFLSTNGFGVLDWADAGDVVGPATSASETLVAFDGTSGKLIKDSGIPYKDVVTMTLPGAGDYVLHSTVGLKTATESNILISDIPTFSAPVGSTNTVVLSAGSGKSLKTTTYTIPSTACALGELLIADGSGNFQCGEDTGGVVSFNGRTGIVTPTATDYTASMIANTASGTISATNAQDAINELNTEKLALAGGTMTGILKTSTQNALQLNPFNTGTGNTGEIRFEDLGNDGLGYVGFKAPDDVPSGGIIWTLPKVPGLIGQFLTNMGGEQLDWTAIAGGVNGIGDVMGPASSSTNSIPKFSDSTGKKLSNSGIIISPTNDLSGVGGFTSSGNMIVDTNTFFVDTLANSVGIGNSAPNATLDVTGTAAISNNATIGGSLWVTGQTTFNVGTSTSSTFPTDRGALGEFLSTDGNGTLSWAAGNFGDVVGPGTSASGTLASFNGNTGKLIQDSGIIAANVPTMAVAATGTYRPIVSAGSDKTQMSLGYSIPLVPCTNGQILKSNGTGDFSCADDVSGVTSFNTRAGAVVSMAGDYFSDQISSTPTVNISSSNVKDALDEIYAEKLSLTGGNMTGTIFTNSPIVSTAQDAFELGPFGVGAGNTGEIRFVELAAGGSEYIGFKAPNAIGANVIWTLPAADGVNGAILTTNGNKVLNWNSPSSLGIGDVVGPTGSASGTLASFSGNTGKIIQDSTIVAADVVTNPSTATDTSIPRFSGPSGKIIQGSSVLISATNDVSGIVNFTSTGNMAVGGTDFFVDAVQDQVGIGTAAPDISAILDLNSSTKGLLLPRMATAQRDAIVSADGFMVYNLTTNTFDGRVNGVWKSFAGDLVGPANSTDTAIARFDGTTGKLIQNSGVVIDDTDSVGNVTSMIVNGNTSGGFISIQDNDSSPSADDGNIYFEGPNRNNGWNIKNNRTNSRLEFYYMPAAPAVWNHRISFDGENNRVGIGVATPTFTLDVGGTLGISGQTTFNAGGNALTFPTVTGTPGQFLRTDGIGTLSWASGNLGDVVGPAGSSSGTLASFSGTGGKTIQDSGIVAANVVQGPGTATATSIALFNGTTGKLIQSSGVLINATNDVAGVGAFTSTGNMTVDTNTFFVNATGDQVGIGTTAPYRKFDVVGDIITSVHGHPSQDDPLEKVALRRIGHTSGTSLAFAGMGITVKDLESDGLTPNANNAHIGFYTWGVGIFNQERIRITERGRLGIGTTNPTELLDVRGNARLGSATSVGNLKFFDTNNTNFVALQSPPNVSSNTTWTLPAADGASGTMLATNGSGVLSWTAITGGTGGIGDVIGPAGSASGTLASFNGTTGKLIQDSGIIAANVPTMAANATGTYQPILSAANNSKSFISASYSIPLGVCPNGQILKSNGTNFICGADTGGVISFNSRTGAVVPTATDYTASMIASTPSGAISATNTQGALNELDVEKLALAGGTMTGQLITSSQNAILIGKATGPVSGELRFEESGGTEYVGFKAPANASGNIIWTLPAASGASGTILTTNGAPNVLSWSSPSSLNIGDVVGPSTATDNAIARFDGTGKLIQNSSVIIDDNANILASGFLSPTFTIQSNSASAVNSGQIKLLDSTGAFGYILQHDTSVEKLKFIAQTAAGTFADKVLFPITGTTVMEAQGNVTILGNLALGSTSTVGNLKFYDQDNSHYVALQAPVTVTTNPTWTLPAADGASGTMLATNGSGGLSWAAITGGTGGIGNVVGPASAVSGTLASFDGITGKLIKDSGIVAANVLTHPSTATDTAIPRFDGTTGKLIEGSGVLISDTNDISGIQKLTAKGTNTNTPASLTSSIDFMIGRTNTGGLASGQSSADLAFEYGGSGYKHYITTTHNGVASSTQNSFRFYLNNGVTAGASSAPGTNNILGLAITPVGVGILNATPTEALDVRGNARLGSDTSVGNLKFYDQDSSRYVALQSAAVVTNDITWTLPAADGASGTMLATNGSGILSWTAITGGAGGIGNVVGPGSSTDNAIARFDLGTGKLIQNSGVIIDDADNVTGIQNLTVKGTNSNASSTATAAVNLMIGRSATGGYVSPNQTSADIALEYGGANGGYKHYISSTHTGTPDNTNNAINFYINNGGQTASTTPGTGNVLAMGITPKGVGVLNTTPTEALDVRGNIKATGQAYSTVYNNAALTTFNFNNGNVQYTSASCQAITLQNMVDGGSYQVVIQGTTSGTCTFTHTGVTSVRYAPANGVTTGGSHSVYSLTKVGAIVYVSWITGFL